MLDWLAKLPLALECADVRVVHASWHQPAIDALRGDTQDVRALYAAWSDRLERLLVEDGLYDRRAVELATWGDAMVNRDATVPMLPATMAIDVRKQTDHPVKALTSGLEQPTAQPFFGGGKWRMTERVAWWEQYDVEPAVIFGHYWRWAGDERDATARSRGPNLFEGKSPWAWLGPQKNAMCVDYCAGLRWRERAAGVAQHMGVAAAVRWPERQVVISG